MISSFFILFRWSHLIKILLFCECVIANYIIYSGHWSSSLLLSYPVYNNNTVLKQIQILTFSLSRNILNYNMFDWFELLLQINMYCFDCFVNSINTYITANININPALKSYLLKSDRIITCTVLIVYVSSNKFRRSNICM